MATMEMFKNAAVSPPNSYVVGGWRRLDRSGRAAFNSCLYVVRCEGGSWSNILDPFGINRGGMGCAKEGCRRPKAWVPLGSCGSPGTNVRKRRIVAMRHDHHHATLLAEARLKWSRQSRRWRRQMKPNRRNDAGNLQGSPVTRRLSTQENDRIRHQGRGRRVTPGKGGQTPL